MRVYGWSLVSILPVFDLILAVSAAAIFVGSVLAMGQTNIKRTFAFSTVAQMGYIFLGLALGTESAMLGAFLYAASHAFAKACMFLVAGNLAAQAGVTALHQMAGIGHAMPVSMTALVLAGLCMVGIPPSGGFLGKWYLVKGCLEAGRPYYAAAVLLGSFLTFLYLFPLVAAAFFRRPGEAAKLAREAPPIVLAPVVFLAIASVALAFPPRWWWSLLERSMH